MKRLYAGDLRRYLKPGRHSDGGNLYLNVTKTQAKSWVFLWRQNGRLREMGLGSATGVGKAGAVSLAEARDLAREAAALVRSGSDPIAERKAQTVMTFAEAAEEVIEALSPDGRMAPRARPNGARASICIAPQS